MVSIALVYNFPLLLNYLTYFRPLDNVFRLLTCIDLTEKMSKLTKWGILLVVFAFTEESAKKRRTENDDDGEDLP